MIDPEQERRTSSVGGGEAAAKKKKLKTPPPSRARAESISNVIRATADLSLNSCEGIDVTCRQSLELISALAEVCMSKTSHSGEVDSTVPSMAIFTSRMLTKKLMDQLEDPLAVVSGALPEWCRVIPFIAPRVFSHESRRTLLERGAFGVSRAVFRQQENKVDVAGLRSRMDAIRQRAIALMQEAFSVDAEDPMALQLQADELYTLEESLKAQVASAFKRQRWAEHCKNGRGAKR